MNFTVQLLRNMEQRRAFVVLLNDWYDPFFGSPRQPKNVSEALQPPQAAPVWDHTPESLRAEMAALLTAARDKLDAISALPKENRSFDAVFGALAQMECTLANRVDMLRFNRDVGRDSALREASAAAEMALNEFRIGRTRRLDLFEAVQDAYANAGQISEEDARFAEHIIREGRRAGLHLPEAQREELKALENELAKLSSTWKSNRNEENGRITFEPEELEGVPRDAIAGYAKCDDGKLEVTFQGPDIDPILSYAKRPETRRKAEVAYASRFSANEPVLDAVLAIRRKIARLLQYDTWADYATEVRMARNGRNVVDFLDDLEQRFRPVVELERQELLTIKREVEGDEADDELYTWDNNYYSRILTERTLQIDSTSVKEHLPVEHVVEATFKIYQNMFGLTFVPLSNDADRGDVWHPDVKRYAVWDNSAQGASDFLGYAYLDIYSRQGKYQSPSMYSLIPGYQYPDGTGRNYPVAAIVANSAKEAPDYPALMSHFSTVIFFHEVGHMFHDLISRVKYSRFHGPSGTPTDFGEAPSQMLENWCYEPKVLSILMSHYKTHEPASAELIDKVVKLRNTHIGIFQAFQILQAKYDMVVHMDTEGRNYTELWSQLSESITQLKRPGVAPPAQCTVGHLVGGDYDAGYYSYLYSNVFAVDMYQTVFKNDPFNTEAWIRYKNDFLKYGGSRDGMDLLTAFLGRIPTSEAFLNQLMV